MSSIFPSLTIKSLLLTLIHSVNYCSVLFVHCLEFNVNGVFFSFLNTGVLYEEGIKL